MKPLKNRPGTSTSISRSLFRRALFLTSSNNVCEADGKKAYNSQRQADALGHDRQLYSRAPHNHTQGEPVFDVLNAKPLLRKDIADKKHKTMTPSQLQQSRPGC